MVKRAGPGTPGVLPDPARRSGRTQGQAPAPPGGAGGSGLGLAVVNGLAVAHGGSVRAESDPSKAQGGLGGARLLVPATAAEGS